MKAASKAERQVRTYKGGSHTFDVPENGFPGIYYLYKSLGYRGDGFTLQKDSRASPQDDLSKNYRIEAIDPKTGKARIFTFPIKD